MASLTLTLTVPDAAVPLIRRTLAWRLDKAVSTTNPELRADIEAYLLLHLKGDVRQQKQQEARDAALSDDSDGTASW